MRAVEWAEHQQVVASKDALIAEGLEIIAQQRTELDRRADEITELGNRTVKLARELHACKQAGSTDGA